MTITANNAEEVSPLLEAALADWVDFVFFSVPKSIVIYADHDEYTTFYANSHSNLNRIKEAMSRKQFKSIEGY